MKLSVMSVADHYPKRTRTVAEFYKQIIKQAVYAEELGYEGFWIAEHHFHEYGVVPDPSVMLAAIAQRTERLKLGTAISVLTFRNPLLVAESYAMVDQLSNGRLCLGVGSGYLKHEFEGFGIDAAKKRDIFNDHLDIVRGLLQGERVEFHGRHVDVPGVQINVLPVQRPVPIYEGILRREAAYEIGLKGRNMLWVPYTAISSFSEIQPMMDEFHRGRSESGNPASPESSAAAFHTFVAETDAAAREQASEAFDLYVESRLYAKKQVYDDILRSGLALFGSVSTVTDKLISLYKMGVQNVLAIQNFGFLNDIQVRASMSLLATKVLPEVHHRIGRVAPKKISA